MHNFCLAVLFTTLTFSSNAQIVSCIDKTVVTSLGVGESGVLDVNAKWTNASTLTVRFLGGSLYIQQKIKQYAHVWENYANIRFNFIEYGDADIRIGFNRGGYWSYAGTQAKRINQNEQTMNYEGFNENTREIEIKRAVLHEFGHALGLLHEHKSPLSRIQWNKPAVYAHYLQMQNWSPQQVDEQVLNRYSVTMSNKDYDPASIMHYPIDPALTLNGYSVGWNTDLSPGDKKLIGEMYPFSTTTTSTGGNNASTVYCTLKNITLDHNVYIGGKYGMRIKGTFQVDNAQGRRCKFVTCFYTSNGTPLRDFNQQYYSSNGNVAVGKDIVPNYSSTLFTNEELFIPYDELHLLNGNHSLKTTTSVFDDQNREIATGGAAYFTYRNGPVFSDIVNVQSFDNTNFKLVVMPKFTIENARSEQFSVVAYFYFENETPVTYYDNGLGQYRNLSFSSAFAPGYDITTYNYGYYSDLFLNVPYSYFPSPGRRTFYKYFTAIFKDGQQVATSNWATFYLDK
ncbi:M12 family metallopeptidase [Foetidibacter luteolus]|uniref:M12 family metallopeptidase n=1 Tax=Foetidibacter luteolus TaxID=2608880 RepID=UPI00129A7E1E|nr:M12 family metallopeptidase [Foetidibacter luteolus]